jgi:hypothetical protein
MTQRATVLPQDPSLVEATEAFLKSFDATIDVEGRVPLDPSTYDRPTTVVSVAVQAILNHYSRTGGAEALFHAVRGVGSGLGALFTAENTDLLMVIHDVIEGAMEAREMVLATPGAVH